MYLCQQNATVKEFFEELSRQIPNHDFRLITGTQQVNQEDNLSKTLPELRITHLSTVTVIARFNGGDNSDHCSDKTRAMVKQYCHMMDLLQD